MNRGGLEDLAGPLSRRAAHAAERVGALRGHQPAVSCWGLRSYGVSPVIWNGDQHCDHAWEFAGSREGYTSKRKWQHSENGRGQLQMLPRTV